MKIDFLFVTLTPMDEVDHHRRLGAALERMGHVVAHCSPSPGVAERLRREGARHAFSIDEFFDPGRAVAAGDYGLPSLRSLYLPELFTLDIPEDEAVMCQMALANECRPCYAPWNWNVSDLSGRRGCDRRDIACSMRLHGMTIGAT